MILHEIHGFASPTFLSFMTSARAFPNLYAVETLNLSKKYGKTDALRSLNFTVNKGEIMVILGANESSRHFASPCDHQSVRILQHVQEH